MAFDGALLYFPGGVRLSPEKPAVLLIEGEDGQGEEMAFQVRSELEIPKIDPNKQLVTFLLAQMSTKELVPVRPIDAKQQRALWPTKAKVTTLPPEERQIAILPENAARPLWA